MDSEAKAVLHTALSSQTRVPVGDSPQPVPRGQLLKLWSASASSNLADGVFQVALALLAVHITRSPTAVAGVLFAARLPWLLLTLHVGVIADRMDRRRLLAGASIGRALLIGALALLTFLNVESLILLYVVAFGLGIAETLFDTSVHSILPRVVEPRDLERTNGYMQSAELLMQQFLGPPLGGLLVGVAIWLGFGTSAVMYLGAALLLLALRGRFRPQQQPIRHSVRREIGEGLVFLWRHPLLRIFALTTGALNLAFAATMSVLPLYAVAPGPMGLSSATYGLLLTGSGIGGLIAALTTPRLEAWLGPSRLLLVSIAGFAVGFLIPALTAAPLLVAFGLTITGTTIFWNVVTVSFRQRIVADHLLGRVNASYRLFAYGALPIGAAIGGFIGETFGLRAVFALAAALIAGTLLPIARRVTPRQLAAALAEGQRMAISSGEQA